MVKNGPIFARSKLSFLQENRYFQIGLLFKTSLPFISEESVPITGRDKSQSRMPFLLIFLPISIHTTYEKSAGYKSQEYVPITGADKYQLTILLVDF